MKKTTHKNRYGDVYEFEETPKGIKWTGPFHYVRMGHPNDYTKAYEAYANDVDTDERLTLGEFITEIHTFDIDNFKVSDLLDKYGSLVVSKMDEYNMVDPSGGPAIFVGTNMKSFGIDSIVTAIEPIVGGYLLKT